MNPQEEILKEVTIAISLYKESLEILDTCLTTNNMCDEPVKNLHGAREYMFSFLNTPQYEEY